MRILFLGMGAIGSYVGGSLAAVGEDISFVERPEVVQSQAGKPLRIISGETNIEVPNPKLFKSLSEALGQAPFDLAVLAVKSYDTEAIINQISSFSSVFPPVLCLQNGVENEARLEKALGVDGVIPGTVTTAIGRGADGQVIVDKLRGIGIWQGHNQSQRLFNAMEKAGLRPRMYDQPASMKWSKLFTNLTCNATSAILNLSPKRIFSDPIIYKIEAAQLREALDVMHRSHIPVIDLPGTPVRAFAGVVHYTPPFISRLILKKIVGAGRGEKMPSFHIDLYAGRKQSEVEYLNGAVVRFGEKVGVNTPVNRKLTEILLALVSGKIPLNHYSNEPHKLTREIFGQATF
jgi:2-dehydropantoate 2-reductase